VGVSLWTHIVRMVKWQKRFNARRRVGFGPRSAASAVSAVARAVASRVSRSSTKTMTQRTSGSSAPLTGHYDYKTDYRKRRKTKFQKRKAKGRRKWSRRVLKVVRNGNVGTVHLVKRSFATLTTLDGTSNSLCYGLNTLNGTASDAFNTANDMGEFLKEKDAVAWNNYNSTSVTDYQEAKLWVMHGTMEMTIRNTHATADAIIEAYYIRGTRPLPSEWSNANDTYVRGFYRQGRAQDPDTGALYDAPLTFATVGVTPFQNATFSRHYNIYKRQKFLIPAGGEINVVIHSRRPSTYSTSNTYNYATDRRFHGVLFQQQGTPTAATMAEATSVTYLSVRRYRAKFIPGNFVTDAIETTDP